MSDPDEISTMITDVEQRSEKLNDWETGFIDSISHQLKNGKTLTPNQLIKLEMIWERVT